MSAALKSLAKIERIYAQLIADLVSAGIALSALVPDP
jgi:hypothetical protein